MSFECKYYLNGHCELLSKECSPGQKGCVLGGGRVFFIGEDENASEKKDQISDNSGE